MIKRNLTKDEIEDVLSGIKPSKGIPKKTGRSVVEKLKGYYRKDLIDLQIYPEIIPQLKAQITKDYLSTLVHAGETVGVITAQSIGERQTQNTLNMFHHAGMLSNLQVGVNRFSELLNATREPKISTCKIHISKKVGDVNELRDIVGDSLTQIRFKDIYTDFKIIDKKQEESWYHNFSIVYDDRFYHQSTCISFDLDISKIFKNRLNLEKIKNTIEDEYDDLFCVFSPMVSSKFEIFLDSNQVILDEKVAYITEDNKLEIYIEDVVIPNLNKLTISGIEGISETLFNFKDNEWYLNTYGSNFIKILSLEFVDKERTVSNNIFEIYNTLGIEATRQHLLNEFRQITGDHTVMNERHLTVLVDVMTLRGFISSISRYGMKREFTGPLAKASFEESLMNFLNAGAFGEKENTCGTSASVICGKIGNFGTGICDLMVNTMSLNPRTVKQEVKEKNIWKK